MIVAVGTVRDEEDIIAGTIRHLLDLECDIVIVADNRSVDGTRPLLNAMARTDPRIVVVDDLDPRFLKPEKSTNLARMAAERGAQWIIPFDADERVFVRGGGSLRFLDTCPMDVIYCDVYEYLWTPGAVPRGDPPLSMGLRTRFPTWVPKVIFRWTPDVFVGEGHHEVKGVGSRKGAGLFLRHYPHRSAAQVLRKIRQGAEARRMAHRFGESYWLDLDKLSDEALIKAWEGRRTIEDTVEDPPLEP